MWVRGSGIRVAGEGFKTTDLSARFRDSGVRVPGFGFAGFRGLGSGSRLSGFSGFRSRISGGRDLGRRDVGVVLRVM